MPGNPKDRQTDRDESGFLKGSGKTTHWAITVYEGQWHYLEKPPQDITWVDGQYEECPTTQKKHFQGACITRSQHRWSGCKGDYKVAESLRQILPGVHFEPASDWKKLLQYCKKEETRIPGTQYEARANSIPSHFQYADDCGLRIYQGIKEQNLDLTKENIMVMLDLLVSNDIASGKRYAAWITTNPMWITMWNKWHKQFVFSFSNIDASPTQTSQETPS